MIPLQNVMAVNLIDIIQNLICYHAQYRNGLCEQVDHVTASARVTQPLQKHTQSFGSVTNCLLVTTYNSRNPLSPRKSWNVGFLEPKFGQTFIFSQVFEVEMLIQRTRQEQGFVGCKGRTVRACSHEGDPR